MDELLTGLLDPGFLRHVLNIDDKVVKYMGSDAETLDLVTPACLGKECLEDVDLESGLQ